MKCLDLFSGTRSIAKAFEIKGFETFTIELYNIPKEIDIEFLRYPISRTLTIRNPLSQTTDFMKSHFSYNELYTNNKQ